MARSTQHQRLHILKEVLREQPATLGNLIKAFEIIAENCKPESGDTFEHHLINTTLKSAVVGLAGSTTGKADPALSDFIEQLGAHSDMSNISLLFQGPPRDSRPRFQGMPHAPASVL